MANLSDPDEHLLPEQLPGLNEGFYAADPADYFRLRVQMLLLAAGRCDDVSRLLDDGVEWRDIKLKTTGKRPGDDESAADRLESAAIADSEVIFHHAAECLLRLVIAHLGLPPCPQLELAKIRAPGRFKQRVRAEILEPNFVTLRGRLVPVFYGSDDLPASLTPMPSDSLWESAKDAVARWVQHLAQGWLDRAPAYNAAKHGLAIHAGEGGMELGPVGPEDLRLGRQGPMVTFIDRDGPEQDRRWVQRAVFVDPSENLASALMASRLIAQLWTVARFRYLADPPAAQIRLFDDDRGRLDDSFTERHGPYLLQGFTIGLLYARESDESPDAPDPVDAT